MQPDKFDAKIRNGFSFQLLLLWTLTVFLCSGALMTPSIENFARILLGLAYAAAGGLITGVVLFFKRNNTHTLYDIESGYINCVERSFTLSALYALFLIASIAAGLSSLWATLDLLFVFGLNYAVYKNVHFAKHLLALWAFVSSSIVFFAGHGISGGLLLALVFFSIGRAIILERRL